MTREEIRRAADIVRETISARQYAELIGLPVNRAGFTPCPFHSGDHDASMKLYSGTRGFHCFGCGASGDVIELAKRFYNLNFPAAITKVAEDAGIALPGMKPTYDQEQAMKAAEKRKQELERQQKEEQAIEDAYFATLDDYLAIDDYLTEVAAKEWEILKADAAAVVFTKEEIAEAARKRKEREERILYRIIHGGKPSADNLPPFDEEEYRKKQAENKDKKPIPETELSRAINARNMAKAALEKIEIGRIRI